MKYNIQTVTVQYLKDTETNEERFFRGTGDFEMQLPITPELQAELDSGKIQIVEREEEVFVDEVTGMVVQRHNYKHVRRYSQHHQQLDMLWHDINDGFFGENAKNGQWYKAIKEIKDQHPKP